MTLRMHQGRDVQSAVTKLRASWSAVRALGPTQDHIQSEPRVKRPGRETEHYTPPNAGVTNEWSYNSAPHTCLHGTHTDFTFFLFKLTLHILIH
jgi:hypothetical protein